MERMILTIAMATLFCLGYVTAETISKTHSAVQAVLANK